MAAELEERLPRPQSPRLVGHHPPQPHMEAHHFPRKVKVSLFTALIESILLYNAVTWTMNNTMTRMLDCAYNRLLRYALNVSWKDRVTNQSIFGDDIVPVSQRLRQRRLTFIGHWQWPSQPGVRPATPSQLDPQARSPQQLPQDPMREGWLQ